MFTHTVERIGKATLYRADYRDITHLLPAPDVVITDVFGLMASSVKSDFATLCPGAVITDAQCVHPLNMKRNPSFTSPYDYYIALFPDARVILDPCMGLAGIGIAALRAGKAYVGVEIDADRYEKALRRITNYYGNA